MRASDGAKIRVAIVTNIIPSYRRRFYELIFAMEEFCADVFCFGDNQDAITTCHDEFPDRVHLVKGGCWFDGAVGWQAIPFWSIAKEYDVLVVYGNPRILSNVAISLLYKCLRKNVVIWGQVHTAGASKYTERVRLQWWSLYENFFVYTDREAQSLRDRGFQHRQVVGMNNGLDQDEIEKEKGKWCEYLLKRWRFEKDLQDRVLLLSCARLVPKNEFSFYSCVKVLG